MPMSESSFSHITDQQDIGGDGFSTLQSKECVEVHGEDTSTGIRTLGKNEGEDVLETNAGRCFSNTNL